MPTSGSGTRAPQPNQAQQLEPMQIDVADELNDNMMEVVTTNNASSANPSGSSPTDGDDWTIDSCTLDLDSYAQSYQGSARLSRLMFIATHCPSLRIEAIKLAIQHVMTTHNTNLYVALYKKLVCAMASGGTSMADPDGSKTYQGEKLPQLDSVWVEQKAKKAALKLEKLDTDLKNYKSNAIKESIRRGHDDLGDHYLDCGELANALKAYSRARDYCTSGRHVINMCLNVIKVSIYLQHWTHVVSYVNKALGTPDFAENTKTSYTLTIYTRLTCAYGLAELSEKRYKSAAKRFLQANLDYCDIPDLMSTQNVATYGGLCALATYERADLHKYVIASSSFKLFLELDPQLREVILCFYESKYGKCLSLLEEMKDNLLLDIYLSTHVNTIYGLIRNRGLVQYFSPYLSADMRLMASCFNTTLAKLEDELMALILAGQIQARIDSHNKVLHAQDVDQRSAIFEKAIEMGSLYQRRARMLVMRSILIKHNVLVKNSSRGNQVSSVEQTPPQQPQQPVEALKTMINMLN